MKIEIELDSEQIRRVIEAGEAMFDELNRKIENLKGRVRHLEKGS